MSDESGGKKYDSEKPMMHLVDPYFVEEIAKVMTFGAKKYEQENWREGIAITRVLSGLERHLLCIKKGIDIDSESGLNHLAHVAANAMFIHFYLRTRPDLDDRYYIKEQKKNKESTND